MEAPIPQPSSNYRVDLLMIRPSFVLGDLSEVAFLVPSAEFKSHLRPIFISYFLSARDNYDGMDFYLYLGLPVV